MKGIELARGDCRAERRLELEVKLVVALLAGHKVQAGLHFVAGV